MPPNSTHLWAYQLLKSLALMRQHYWRWTLTASSLSTANLMQTSSHMDPTWKWKDHPRTPPRTKGIQVESDLREISRLGMWRRQLHCHSFITSRPEVFPGGVSNIVCLICIWFASMVQLETSTDMDIFVLAGMKWGQKDDETWWHNFLTDGASHDKIMTKTISLTPQLMEKCCLVK